MSTETDQPKTQSAAAVASSDLLACPFCGAPGLGMTWQGEHSVCCSNDQCRVSPATEGYGTRAEAVESWNSRATTTPNVKLPPLGEGPRRKMLIEVEVTEDFEKRLDNQWMVEREIHADRWNWRWAEQANDKAEPPEKRP